MVREIETEDIPRVLELGGMFTNAAKHVHLRPDVFLNTWSGLISSGAGTILVTDDLSGMLGAVAYPDPNSGEMMATEMFWFVDPDKRGRGLELLSAFEKWAKQRGCGNAIMVHLADSMPERLSVLYQRRGYELLETHYIKEL